MVNKLILRVCVCVERSSNAKMEENMKKETLGKLFLLAAALIWGSSFVVMKSAVDFITPFVLLFIRFTLSTLFMSCLFLKKIKMIKKEDLLGGFCAGLALFSAFSIQTFGLRLTTPGKNAFLTAVYCTIVPLGGFLYAVHIIVCEKAMKNTSPIIITILQFAFAAVFSLGASLLFEDLSLITQINSSIYMYILYLAFFATTLCYLFQNVGQSWVNENIAALLLSLESVFGVFFSILLKKETLTLQIVLGFIIIFLSVFVSETKLSFLHKGEEK